MIKATIKKAISLTFGVALLVGITGAVHAQDKPTLGEEFVFFINGANVEIPILDGDVVADPLDPTSDNKVYRINAGNWAESGFRWNEGAIDSGGVDASAMVGDSYGESDTLYFRFLSDSLNIGQNSNIAFFDTRTGIEYGTDDLPFRAIWTIPTDMHNGEWHEIAVPLPPATAAGLDSALAGVDINGDSLTVELDDYFAQWSYPGAWANGVGVFSRDDAEYKDFQWNGVAKFGAFFDTGSAGAPIYFDYFTIGVPPSELAALDSPPAPIADFDLSNSSGVNTVTWAELSEASGYKVYFSESEITTTLSDAVTLLGTFQSGSELSIDHSILAPYYDFAEDFTAYYAVTAVSAFGSESAPASKPIVADASITESYAVELNIDAVDAVFDLLDSYDYDTNPSIDATSETMAGFFPDGYVPFTIDADRKIIENGEGGDDDADISGKAWIGYDALDDLLIIYTEITDDAIQTPPSTVATADAWAYDGWELGLGNYSPESFIISSTHGSFQRGENPDYQFRAGMYNDRAPFIHTNDPNNGEMANSQTIADITENGYRMLTVMTMISLTAGEENTDRAFDFPDSDEIKTYPFNWALNDRDDAGGRDTQVSWSLRAGGDTWWNNPTKWQTIAFVGENRVVEVSNEEEIGTTPLQFSLEQNYPNPFNPSTNIQFTLANTSDVSLEVFNMLGQKVATILQNEKMTAGSHTQAFNASSLASGMYVYRISTPDFTMSRKMMLIK